MTERTTHGNNLAFVMKSMGQDMMQDQRRSADRDVPIGEMKFGISVELLDLSISTNMRGSAR